jgi:phospholipase D1/2
MDGKPYLAGRFALSLRKRLFQEHLGLLNMECEPELDIQDPISDSFYKETWIRIAALNTKIYEEVFHCIPCKISSSKAS